jgi:hypothetical protein
VPQSSFDRSAGEQFERLEYHRGVGRCFHGRALYQRLKRSTLRPDCQRDVKVCCLGRPEMTGRAVRVTRLTHNPRPGSKSLYLALGIAGALVGARVGCFGIWFSWFRNNNRYDPRGGAFHNWLAAVTEALSRRMRQRRRLPIKHLGCDTHQTGALDVVRRPKATPVHELERYMRCKDCSQVRCYTRTSAATSWRCDRPRFPPAIRRRLGGRAKDKNSKSGSGKMTEL